MSPDPARRQPLMEELLRRFSAAVRGAQLYAPGHPLVARNTVAFTDALLELLSVMPSLSIGLLADEIVVGDRPMPRGTSAASELFGRLRAHGIERITFDQGVTGSELFATIDAFCRCLRSSTDDDLAAFDLDHVHVGVLHVEKRAPTRLADMATVRELHARASSTMKIVWNQTAQDGTVDNAVVQEVVDQLAQAVSQNRDALVALTALRAADDYTFTHMVNVSILTMMQAQGLGIDGPLLREFGVAGLMHDIGKVWTPPEILAKPGKLDDREMALVRLHPIDGAQILRKTLDLTPLAAVVAFEHHLRLDGTGYPAQVARDGLNVATMMCAIADVYDAMRTKRNYQEAFPSERILEVLRQSEGRAFEPNLVRRFVQLMGLYPAGSLVTLNTGAFAVVLRLAPHDPQRPRVRVIFAADGHRLEAPYDVNLWEVEPAPYRSSSVTGPATAPDPDFEPTSVM
jgi:HD-GYP domain-containing protein (c-di-GMP phosphodiesterase class II)